MTLSNKDLRYARRRIFELENAKELKKNQNRVVTDFQFFVLVWVIGIAVLGWLTFFVLWLGATIFGVLVFRGSIRWMFRK